MKKLSSFLITVLSLSLVSCGVQSEPEYEFILKDDNTYEIVSLKGDNLYKELIIPSEINGIKVTSIGEIAFTYQTKLENVTLPTYLEEIGDSAFMNCTSLTNILMPSTLKKLGNGVFESCTSLSSVTLNEGLTYIGGQAFSNCVALREFDFPDSLEYLGLNVFAGCHDLIELTYDAKVVNYIDGWVINSLNLDGEVEIKEGTVGISNNAFYEQGLTSITLPDSLKYIGYHAFNECENLETIYIGKSIKRIDESAFYACNNLVNVHIAFGTPWHKVKVGDEANLFLNAENVYYGDRLFEAYDVPYGEELIESNVFYSLKTLKEVVIPSTVKTILKNAFAFTDSLEKIYIEDLSSWCKIDFETDMSNPLGYNELILDLEVLYDIVIPLDVNEIKPYTFNRYKRLLSVELHDKITFIGEYAFYGCENLKKINLDNVKHISDYAFNSSGLYSVVLSENVITVGSLAFSNCSNVELVSIGVNVNFIGAFAFDYLPSLSRLIFEDKEGWYVVASPSDTIGVDLNIDEDYIYLVLNYHLHNVENPYAGYTWKKR